MDIPAWIAALGGAALGILGMVAAKWFIQVVELVGRKLQGYFAGNRWLHLRALRRYRAAILDTQSTFRPPFAPDKILAMRDIYVPLRIRSSGRQPAPEAGAESGDGKGSGRDGDAYRTIGQVRRAVVTGPPGSGKSKLLQHSLLVWVERQTRRGLRRSRVPVLVELHRTNETSALIRDHIVERFNRNGFADAGPFVDGALADGRLEVLLDGLDEVNTDERERVIGLINDFADAYSQCRVVVTCRTAVYDGQLVDLFPDAFQIAEFDDGLIRRFLRNWPDFKTDKAAVDALMAVLRDAPKIRVLAGNPLTLTMIAYLYGLNYGGSRQVLPHSRAEFYKLAVDTLLSRLHNRLNRYPEWVKRPVLQKLALAGLDAAAGDGRDRLEFSRGAVLTVIRDLLSRLEVAPDTESTEVLGEIVERSGLLVALDGGERFQFAHLTLQEYLAACALRNDSHGLLARYRRDPQVWREVVKLAGWWRRTAVDPAHRPDRLPDSDSRSNACWCLGFSPS